VLGIRPEDIEDAAVVGETPAGRTLSVETDIREDMGAEVFVHFSVQAEAVRTTEVVEALDREAVEAIEERARLKGVPFIARIERTTRAKEGEPIDLVVDTAHLHFFDPETGLGIY
jgi:multiple sugar transport system ATP-binding protein